MEDGFLDGGHFTGLRFGAAAKPAERFLYRSSSGLTT